MIGAIKGYKVEIVMSEAVSVERIKMIEAFGAKVVLTDAKYGTDGAIRKVRKIVEENPVKYFMTISSQTNIMESHITKPQVRKYGNKQTVELIISYLQ